MSRKEQIKELLTFTKGEIQGIRVLIILIVILIVVNISLDYFPSVKQSDNTSFLQEVKEFNAGLTPLTDDDYESRLDKYITQRYDTLKLFSFNPNTTTNKQWTKLGLTNKQITTIDKYLSRGGKFYDKKDFQRMYGIRQKQYEILKPFIDLPDKSNYQQNYRQDNKQNDYYSDSYEELSSSDSSLYFNPNTSTPQNWEKLNFSEKQVNVIQRYFENGGKIFKKEDLLKIYCINEDKYNEIEKFIKLPKNEVQNIIVETKIDINTFSEQEFIARGGFWKYNAEKIIKYRIQLGGFYKKEQLLEIWGMKKEYYDKVSDDIVVSKIQLRKININFAEEEDLSAHPYLKYHNANAIVEYRDKNGSFKNILELRQKKILSQTMYDKIKIYITVK